LQDRQQIQGRSRGPAALIEGESDDEDVEGRMLRQQQLRMGAGMFADGGDANREDPEDLGAMNDYADSKGPLSQWIQKKEVINFISSQFGSFLRTFRDPVSGQTVYEDRIQNMCQRNKQSFEINFTDLSSKQPTLAIWLAEEPSRMFPILNQVASDIVAEIFPEYNLIHHEIFVRIGGLPVEDKLRELRQVHLNALIKFRGVVTKRTGVYPQYQQIYFRCECGDIKGPCFSNDQYQAK
jgi:DNA replication licensing factor MCM2